MGVGACRGSPTKVSNVKDEKACAAKAAKCHSDNDCPFFYYRADNKLCYLHHGDTCDLNSAATAWVSYRRAIGGFEYVKPGKCTSVPYRDFDTESLNTKEKCAARCRLFSKCKFFAFKEPKRCILFNSETCHLTELDSGFETYRRGTSQAESMAKPITQANLKHRHQGRCLGDVGMFKNGPGQLYANNDEYEIRPMAEFFTDRYYTAVIQAWIRCFSRDSRTKYVTVWADGGYKCFKEENKCEQDAPNHHAHTYELQNWGPFN